MKIATLISVLYKYYYIIIIIIIIITIIIKTVVWFIIVLLRAPSVEMVIDWPNNYIFINLNEVNVNKQGNHV